MKNGQFLCHFWWFFGPLESRWDPYPSPDALWMIIGPILDDRLKEKILKPWKGALSSHSVCLCVCVSVRRLQVTPFGLGTYFLGWVILGTWGKNAIFLFFEIFIFTLFIGIFRFFPYITLVNFWFQASGHSFSPRIVIFGLSEPCTIENWRLLKFFENSIFYG